MVIRLNERKTVVGRAFRARREASGGKYLWSLAAQNAVQSHSLLLWVSPRKAPRDGLSATSQVTIIIRHSSQYFPCVNSDNLQTHFTDGEFEAEKGCKISPSSDLAKYSLVQLYKAAVRWDSNPAPEPSLLISAPHCP